MHRFGEAHFKLTPGAVSRHHFAGQKSD